MQLNDAFTVAMPATLSAWNASVRSSHGPGHDEDRRDVAELARDLLRGAAASPRAMRAARSGPGGPHTIASWVAREPVMWTSSIPACRVRYAPTSAPPYTTARTPRAIASENASSRNGPRYAFTGFILRTQAFPSLKSFAATSVGGIALKFPAPRTRQTRPAWSGAL